VCEREEASAHARVRGTETGRATERAREKREAVRVRAGVRTTTRESLGSRQGRHTDRSDVVVSWGRRRHSEERVCSGVVDVWWTWGGGHSGEEIVSSGSSKAR
jgi:hypothetical protein